MKKCPYQILDNNAFEFKITDKTNDIPKKLLNKYIDNFIRVH